MKEKSILDNRHLAQTNKKQFLPIQENPSPEYPVLHSQVKLPSVFVQFPFSSQGFFKHSSTSKK